MTLAGWTLWNLPSSKFTTCKTGVPLRICSYKSRLCTAMEINPLWKWCNCQKEGILLATTSHNGVEGSWDLVKVNMVNISNLIIYLISASVFYFRIAYLTCPALWKVTPWKGKSVFKNPRNIANKFFYSLYFNPSS